jgi:lysozyme family protein
VFIKSDSLPASYLQNTLQYEGGYVNRSDDKGGETNRGITIGTLQNAIQKGVVSKSVTIRSLTNDLESVRKIYNDLYYAKAKCFLIPHPLAFAHFDASVHHGVGGAIKLLQQTLNKFNGNLTVDGGFGPLTIKVLDAIILKVAMKILIDTYQDMRVAKFNSIIAKDPTQKVFINGWLNRAAMVRAWCHQQE